MILTMAAQTRFVAGHVEDLRAIQASRLQPLLEEERRNWLSRLHWDFSGSAELVTRYVNMRALDGLVLIAGSEVAGYCYWVIEERKALIGDLYVRDAWRSPEAESELFTAALESLTGAGLAPAYGVRRIESQLMQMGPPELLSFREDLQPERYPRVFMLAPLDRASRLRGLSFGKEIRLAQWDLAWLEQTAELIASVYSGHVDSRINDQYRSPNGAQRFLRNIVSFPGCGVFLPHASFVALSPSGRVVGCVMATRVTGETGHVAQLCVAREWVSRGLGYEMIRRSLTMLASTGCREASLTVTSSNHRALRLYEHIGFRTIHRFEAYVCSE
jgi:ribosomal protein S18 acetylase RimI-like enzyme